jgi:hypothetical protein
MTIKPMRTRFYQAHEVELRAIQIIDLASILGTGAHDGGSVFDPLEEFFQHLLEDGKKHPSVSSIAASLRTGVDDDEADDDDDIDMSDMGATLADSGVLGFAVQFGTPVRTYRTNTSWWSGWGYYTTGWIYAESFEEAWALGVAWAEQSAAEDLERFMAEQKDGAA